jgi:hypothetical protein
MGVTTDPHKTMCVTMTVEEHAELRRMAKRDGYSMSGWIGQVIQQASGKEFPDRRGRGIHLQSEDA